MGDNTSMASYGESEKKEEERMRQFQLNKIMKLNDELQALK